MRKRRKKGKKRGHFKQYLIEVATGLTVGLLLILIERLWK